MYHGSSTARVMEGSYSQNCPSCNNIVKDDDSAVQCEIFCKNWFHCDCVLISSDEYEYMKLLAEKSKWACVACDVRLSKVTNQFSDIDGFINLKVTVNKLLAVIKDVVNDNLSLNEKFDKFIFEKVSDDTRSNSKPDVYKFDRLDETSESMNDNSKLANSPIPLEDDVIPVGDDSKDLINSNVGVSSAVASNRHGRLLYSEVSKTKLVTDTGVETDDKYITSKKVKCGFEVSSKSISETAVGGGWFSATGKKSRKRKPIIGTNKNIDHCNIKAIGKCEWVFVSRLAPEVSKDDLDKFLLDSEVKAECIELRTKYSSYKSFKVGVHSDLTSKLLSADFWPSGTLVREFVPKRSAPTVFSRTFLAKKPDSITVP